MKRPLRTLALAAVAVLPLLLVAGADLAFVPAIEARVEHRARSSAKSASVEAEIGTFPVVGRALALGEVARMDIRWLGVEVGEVQATSLHLHLDGVGFDRSELFSGEVRISGVESGDVRMVVSTSELTRVMGQEIRVRGGALRIRPTPGTEFEVQASATAQGLVLTAPGLTPVTADLGADRIPCAPTAEVEADSLVLACSFRGLPPLLRERTDLALGRS